jgi:hypothetical protein
MGAPLPQRLRAKRQRLLASLDSVSNVGCCLLTGCLGAITLYVGSLMSTLLFASSLGRGDSDLAIALSVIGYVVVLGAVVYGVRYGLGAAARAVFSSYYREATRWLYHTDMLSLFVDENQTAQVVELVNETPGLRWISPPRPRSLEHQLEYAACYFAAYRKLLYGPGRIDAGSVFLGSLAWYAGQRQCIGVGCCCLAFPYGTWLALPAWIIGGIGYLNRLAVEACCIDYLLSEPRDPQRALEPLPPARTHGVGAEQA